jgi:LuxR family maltose regulon positive regulatory protein
MTRALLEMAEQRYVQAERSLRQAISLGREIRFPIVSHNARLLLAHLYVEMGHPRDALAELTPILALCQRQGTPGLILEQGAAVAPVLQLAVEQGVYREFAAHLLNLLGVIGEPRPVAVPETGETLTPRELEVLRLVAAGASNPAIAEQLFITVRTVKSHVSNILRKLDVSSRLQASARARELRII